MLTFVNKQLFKNERLKLIKKSISKNNKLKSEYQDLIKYFINNLMTKNANFDYSLFKKNIIDLLMEEKEIAAIYAGYYNGTKNSILINSDIKNIEATIFHELLHMLSTRKVNNDVYSGLLKNGIFNGINEGYTQLLCKRYFNDSKSLYVTEMRLALLIEKIIGQDKMERFYSKADFYKFIKEIDKYNNNIEDTFNFLLDIDIVHKLHCKINDGDNNSISDYIVMYQNCMLKIMNLYLNKIRKGKEKNKNDIEDFIGLLTNSLTINNEEYEILSFEKAIDFEKKCVDNISKNKQKCK